MVHVGKSETGCTLLRSASLRFWGNTKQTAIEGGGQIHVSVISPDIRTCCVRFWMGSGHGRFHAGVKYSPRGQGTGHMPKKMQLDAFTEASASDQTLQNQVSLRPSPQAPFRFSQSLCDFKRFLLQDLYVR